ncbi:hypothetical protein HCK00_08215 [Streptomyces sp. PLAI1-29]|uniref:HTH luxR-type domain-containing protein n=2 Tax=Streptomyces zingiberis TaxID=2053010 RepID=A0ABX1BYE0_9ACTN|nr:hypothetical protein [Streptomyces zingiberis]
MREAIASGLSSRQNAAAGFIGDRTVKNNHIDRICAKLSVTTRSAAILAWLGRGERKHGPAGGGHG